jgi:6,7-dimethyl-8-ribityllumazine synthase
MSDRYETPSWDDEPEDLGPANRVTADADDVDEASAEDVDLEAASENVFDAWPVAPPAEPDEDEVAGEAGADEAEDEPVAEADISAPAAPEETEEPDEAAPVPPPLADHVSASSEHAPGDLTVPPGYSVLEGTPTGERRAVGLVVSRFNGDVTTKLLESALDELDACGVSPESITVMPVPGAFELPLAAMALAKTRRFACIVALGCVIRGDTPHFDYVASEAASGLQLAAIETGVPVAFGVLTLDRADQAESRQGKGADAVRTALEMADLFANLRAAAAR